MANVKLVETTERLLVILEKSKLFTEKQLDAIKALASDAIDPVDIARAMLKKGWLTKWQASQLLSGFYTLTMGKYQLCDQLGKGELGNVYLAENPKLGRKVALKALSKRFTSDAELVDRFLAEARAAAALDHRNIVHVHDVSSEGNRHYVVMEHVTGRDLQQKVTAEGKLTPAEASDYIRQAAEGLRHAHAQGVIHRDIKPGNLMVDDQGVLKILDIGVGQLRVSGQDGSESTGELLLSTGPYMAPEQARAEQVDGRCDIYSLGAVLYFLLTARAPFDAQNDDERAQIKKTKQPIPLSQLCPDLPAALVETCQRMLAVKPDERLASMGEVISSLGDGGEQMPVATALVDDVIASGPIDSAESAAADLDDSDESKKLEAAAESSSQPEITGIKIDLGAANKSADAAAPVAFSINTKTRKKKPAPTPAKAEVTSAPSPEAAVAAESPQDAAPTPAEGKKRLSRRVLIGGVCAAGLVLLLSGVGVAMLFRGGGSQVAQSTTADAATAPAAINDDAEAAFDIEAPGAEPAPTEGDATASDAAVASPEPAPASAVASAAPIATESGEVPDPAAVSSAAETPAPVAAADVAMAEPPAAPAADATPTEAPQPSPPPAVAEVKPATPPAKPAAPAAPKVATFVLPAAVDLPVPAADAPEMVFGQINIRPEDAVFISLYGGETAATGRLEFSLQNARGGVAPRDWEFYLSDGRTESIVVATLSMPENSLKFNWTSQATENSAATNLRNCSLKITAGQDKPHELALRTPQQTPPYLIDLERAMTIKLPLEGAPDRASLKLEVTVVGHKAAVEPAQIELSKGGKANVYFGENQEQSALMLKLDVSLTARAVQVKTDPFFLVPVEKEPLRLNKASLKKYSNAGANRAQIESFVKQLESVPAAEKIKVQNELLQAKQNLGLIDQVVAKMSQLEKDTAAVGSGATLRFRVYSDLIDRQIELVITDPNASPVAP